MQKSSFTTLVLIAILLTGAISTALPPMIVTEAYAEPDKKASPESHGVKSPKKIKIIDCNNRNFNAQGVEELSTIEQALNKAFSSSNKGQFNKPGETKVFFIEPNTKIIFKCNNQNTNIPPPRVTTAQEVADTDTPTATKNTELKATSAHNHDKTGVKSSTKSLGTSQSGISTSKPFTSGTSSPTPSSDAGAINSLLPSIQQMNPSVQQKSLPSGDPMLQLKSSLSPLS